MGLFRNGIQNSIMSEVLTDRITNIIDYFTFSIYQNVCRSLFEKHKLLFSFLLCIRIMQGDNKVDAGEFKFLLSGPPSTKTDGENPAPEWLTINSWTEFSNMHFELPAFKGLTDLIREHKESFKQMFDSAAPEDFEFPGLLQEQLTVFQRILVLRGMRMDKVTEGVQQLVSFELGTPFIEPPPFNLALCYADSTVKTPLIFVFVPGSDPASDLYKFSGDMKMDRKLEAISLGQGQGPIAEALIQNGQNSGGWVFLQNCHLSVSWMPKLEKIVETTNEDLVHRDYRLWLTSEPSRAFPIAVLQDGVKMTVEPPKGLKANLIRSFNSFTDAMLDDCEKPKEYRSLLYALCFYHAIVQDRRKFGPLGWNILYDFAQSDISICTLQLRIFLNEYKEVPYKVLQYLFSEVNYGGRITDDKDRRLNNSILEAFICKDSLSNKCKLSPSGTYIIPRYELQQEILDFLKSLPVNPAPEVFGLHDNAAITSAQNEIAELFENALSVQPRSSSGEGKSRDQIIREKAEDILERIPSKINMDPVHENYPTLYTESMNTVLTQEVIRYNTLLASINSSLKQILKALKGLVVMSDMLDALGTSLFNNAVPSAWASVAPPSLMPLAGWAVDLEARLHFIKGWIDHGHPDVYWISGFFFPQAFLTGTLQNYARRNKVAIDTISYGFEMLKQTKEEITGKPEAGCYVYGLFLEGARWDDEIMLLAESAPKKLFVTFPLIWFSPATLRVVPTEGIYNCPVYKTLTRAGTLSTTGHSTNFVLWIEIPSDQMQK
jgi:dynein heavy chain